MNTKALITYIVTALFLFIGTVEAQYHTPQNNTVSQSQLYRNDSNIIIYGKVYWHYVRIGNYYYSCADKESIVQALVRLNKRVQMINDRANKHNEVVIGRNKISKNPKDEKDLRLYKVVDVKEYISEVKPPLLKDPVKPKQKSVRTGSSLRYPRKLKP